MPELLSPAGNFEKMKAAIRFGADAVYLAGTSFGMRAVADNFSPDEIIEAIKYAHERNVKVYITVNTMPRVNEYPALKKYLSSLEGSGVDALIIADLGVMSIAREILPSVPIHISTQSSIVSDYACEAYHKLGASRIVLARELSLDEIRQIRRNISPEIELETFIHGSMCVSYSGRCLLSEYFTGRDANRGLCAQPCRWNFKRIEISEEKRPDMQFPVEEGPDGTFIMSSKDMCMIEHIPELMESGIDSFKIEGRMKSAYYTAVITNAYRMAIDKYRKNPEDYKYDPNLMREVESVSHREYCTGYYFDHPIENAQKSSTTGYMKEKAYLAYVKSFDLETKIATFVQRNKLVCGSDVELLSPGKFGRAFKIEKITLPNGNEIDSTPHPYMEFNIQLPFDAEAGDIIRGK